MMFACGLLLIRKYATTNPWICFCQERDFLLPGLDVWEDMLNMEPLNLPEQL